MPGTLTPEEIARHIAVVQGPGDPRLITASAVALAASEDVDGLIALGRNLRTIEFMRRIDPPDAEDVDNLGRIFKALIAHPTEVSGRLCELLYDVPKFREVPMRINYLLVALAAVRPTTDRGANVFRSTAQQGYAQVSAPVLLENESPLALQVFEEMIAGNWIEDYVKVDILHRALLPVRTQLPVIKTCFSLLTTQQLAPDVRNSLIETLFDYRSRDWFGPAMYPPKPQPWSDAPTLSLRGVVVIANRILPEDLEPYLRGPVESTRAELEGILRSRE